MRLSFSTLLQTLEHKGIRFKETRHGETQMYEEYRNLYSEVASMPDLIQRKYADGVVYVGKFEDFHPNALSDGCAFIFLADKTAPEGIPDGIEYATVSWAVRNDVFDALEEVFYSGESMRMAQRLSAILIEKQGLQYLVDFASELLENPIIVCDSINFSWAVFSSQYQADTTDFQSIINLRELPPEYMSDLSRSGADNLVFESNYPVLIDVGSYSASPRIVQGMIVDGQLVGTVTLVQSNRRFRPSDREAVRILAAVIRNEIRRNGIDPDTLQSHRLLRLIEGDAGQQAFLAEWARPAGSQNIDALRLMVAEPVKEDAIATERLLRRAYKNANNCMIARLDNRVFLIAHLPSIHDERAFVEEFERVASEARLKAAFSDTVFDFATIPQQFEILQNILETGKRLEPERCCYPASDYSVFGLLSTIEDSAMLRTFIMPQLTILERHDAQNGTSYCQTLEVFARSKSRGEAAAALFIRSNTLDYRMNRIKAMLSIDEFSPTFLTRFLVSLQIKRYLDVQSSDE